ncbi:hypothetical protein ABB37_05768 [Leptomonas pyrrhocoris]|uniref:Uncharacterized protein n=1 Tax=Leptomonas pyrrhocoris TaxID=157538 RepID=A0A0M9FZJ3_LEPPY|nr:hypothetical protein ABB37_05768 [Leptomonas pyrrhocoris]KPA79305.1 hypothetical protein ABB37_05768 [Leptomonas pyrrhocoris]|eukprot:XP_015657744.1 hypothetical protein ABB37_05768 [Leptomonas pyrrhocoris]
MKRTSDGDAVDRHHPALSFHREVLIVQQWTRIRRSFLQALETVAADEKGGVQWREPRKLWRHAQEALGKWILSQVARVHLSSVEHSADATTPPSASSPLAAELHETDIHFFPTAAQLRQAAAHCHRPSSADLVTYDEQLVRDLSLKSNGTHNAAAVAAIAKLVKEFNLPQRCVEAAAAVEAAMRDVAPSQALRPRIRRIEAADPHRTAQQQRIAGPIAEVSVQWPRHWRREQCRDCPAVSLPWAAMEKLRACYDFFSEENEQAQYDGAAAIEHPDAARQQRFELRAAAVILRYEGGLATGSLQLCADTRLKQHLHAMGYHVMDLCASPINAYMGVPQLGSFSDAVKSNEGDGEAGSSTSTVHEVPNYFCSAFYDTDRYFGSVGSAVAVDPLHICHVPRINPEKKPLLLTLDVPYDEDLCELLFQKLAKDMRRATAEASTSASTSRQPPAVVDYILVLPLWWDIPMQTDKRFFAEITDAAGATSSAVSDDGGRRFIRDRAAMLEQGYTVSYTWPTALAEAAGDAWVCFDGVFVDDRYGYFCTATNRWLHGVTTTEVIGLAQPRREVEEGSSEKKEATETKRRVMSPLQQALDAFYGPAVASA